MKSLFRWLAIACAWILLSSISAHATVYISGKVVAKDTGKPLPHATVMLYNPANMQQPLDTVTSLGNGSYVLKAPAPGAYRITADEAEHSVLATDVTVPVAGLAAFDLQVAALPSVHVRVRKPDGQPDAGAEVQVWWSLAPSRNGSPAVTKTTSKDGTLDLSAPHGLPVALVMQVRIDVRDAAQGCGQQSVDGWPTEVVDLSLQPGARLTGTVVDDGGKPIPHVPISATRVLGMVPAEDGQITAATNEAGQYDIPALFYGTYIVRATIPNVGNRYRQVVLSQPTTAMTMTPSDQPTLPHVFFPFGHLPPFFHRPRMPNLQWRGQGGVPYGFPFPTLPRQAVPLPHGPIQPLILPETQQAQAGPGLPQPLGPGPFNGYPYGPYYITPDGDGLALPAQPGVVPVPLPHGGPFKDLPNGPYYLTPDGAGFTMQVQPGPIPATPYQAPRSRDIPGDLRMHPQGLWTTPKLAPPVNADPMPRVTP